MNKKLKKILSISSVLVLGLSFAQATTAQTLEEQIALAEVACQEALEIGTFEALEEFRKQYGNLPTACTALAQVTSASINSALFDVNEGPSSTASGSGGGSVSVGSGTGGGGDGGSGGNGGNGGSGANGGNDGSGANGGHGGDGCGCTIIELLRVHNTDETGLVDLTLDDLQSQFDATN